MVEKLVCGWGVKVVLFMWKWLIMMKGLSRFNGLC